MIKENSTYIIVCGSSLLQIGLQIVTILPKIILQLFRKLINVCIGIDDCPFIKKVFTRNCLTCVSKIVGNRFMG